MIPAGLVLPGILATIALIAWARGWRIVEFSTRAKSPADPTCPRCGGDLLKPESRDVTRCHQKAAS